MKGGEWTSPGYEQLAMWLRRQAGLAISAALRGSAEDGIRRAMERASVRDVSAYLGLLETGDASLDDLIAELTVGETYFFRGPEQFEFVRKDVLPGLLRARGPDYVVRV